VSQAQTDDEGLDGTVIAYRERVHAPWPVWLITAALAAMLAVAYGYRLGLLAGVVTFVVPVLLLGWLLAVSAPVIAVDDRVFRAGRARLPLTYVGRIAPLDAEQSREVKGARADPRAYLCTRGWVARTVLVEVDDPDDPHPYWLVSTRHGERLAPILAAARDRARA
jgi:hypothetical protein